MPVADETRKVGACWECGYSLRGLETPRCPECGRAFDPNDPPTMNMNTHVGPVARYLMKPPGWPVHLLTALAVLASLWAAATPMGPGRLADVTGRLLSNFDWTWADLFDLMSQFGTTEGRYLIAVSIWLTVALAWICRRIARGITVKRVSNHNAATFAYWRRWLVSPVVLGLTLIVCWTRFPVVAGFWLSKPWLEKAVAEVRISRRINPVAKWIGIYPPPPVRRSTTNSFEVNSLYGETWIWMHDDGAFVHCDDGQPPDPRHVANRWGVKGKTHIQHLYGPWYSVDFARYGEN
jgi:hypothetical protein